MTDPFAWPFSEADTGFDKVDILTAALDRVYNMELERSPEDIATVAIDATLVYVVDWLNARGDMHAGELLEVLGELNE